MGDVGSENDGEELILANIFSRDPAVDKETWDWLLSQADGPFTDLMRSKQIFTSFEFDRKVPLMFTLNIMCTFMTGYFQRNNRVRKFLEERASSFPERDEVISAMNKAGAYINSMNLPDGSMWWNKANFFSLVSELSRLPETMKQSPQDAKQKLLSFADRVPSDYALAAREAVGQKAERELRGKVVRTLLLSRLASTK